MSGKDFDSQNPWRDPFSDFVFDWKSEYPDFKFPIESSLCFKKITTRREIKISFVEVKQNEGLK